MRKAVIALAALAVLAAPAAPRAEEKAEGHGDVGLKLGVGLGYGIPFGDATQDHALSGIYAGEIPVELELSYKFTHAISAGVYAGYGYGLVSTSGEYRPGVKASDVVESIATWRFGVQGEYEFGKMGSALPWAGLRIGYVTESISLKNGGGTAKATGWEYLTLMGGADFEIAKAFAVGPFLALSFGQYTTEQVPGESSASIPSGERTIHEWLTIGVRATFDVGATEEVQ